jgi:tRNA uridine 5-carbamoylmethylation protein Kti12
MKMKSLNKFNFSNNFLIILCGLPASGKSTFAQEISELIEANSTQIVKIVDPDQIRNQISPTFNFTLEKNVRNKHLVDIEYFLKRGMITISDDLNYYSSMRHQLKDIAEKLNKKFYIIYISTPVEVCLKWNKVRGSPIPDSVLLKVDNKFDNFQNYQWDTPSLILDMSKTSDLKHNITTYLNSLQFELKKKQMKKSSSNQLAEQLDSITRKIISELFQDKRMLNDKSKILKLRKQFIKKTLGSKKFSKNMKEDFIDFLKENVDTNKSKEKKK